ncbi:hypothetical protein BS50DRAFT_567440 [Corynespora cassiicola Philippines]|uniref:TPR-like protein n=1 Tax=Corynespora cassiicola Philippines TaxID=1448308 RepID=A0A2T2PAG2_CORCC|nr:hypothetical protein BS50DRAFT_567440 [Corynespora cassiicola Philippines]
MNKLIRPVNFWIRGYTSKTAPCVFCQSRQFSEVPRRQPLHTRSANGRRSFLKGSELNRKYATHYRQMPLQFRGDRRAQNAFFQMAYSDNVLRFQPDAAASVIDDFCAASHKAPAENVRALAAKYKADIEDIAVLGLVIQRIPQTSKVASAPNENDRIARAILLACVEAKDPYAIIQIMNAVYLSNTLTGAKNITKSFSSVDLALVRTYFDSMVAANHPNALTLQGQFLERTGKTNQARALYEKALQNVGNWDLTTRFTLSLPNIAPWNALGNILVSEKDPNLQAQAKAAYEKGVQMDDPLAYYNLALTEDAHNSVWLKGMTKAAASGHTEAMYKLANFYINLDADKSPLQNDGMLAKALNWLTQWKPGSPQKLGREWLSIAAGLGHKPSMLELVKLYEMEGDKERVKGYLQEMTVPPPTGKMEQWPQLVEQAHKRLGVMARLGKSA